jgi:glycosyltransferase involved in cell wall biosynthesis
MGLLEAQACGVPQIATAVGGSDEVVTRETGELVSPDDPERLAEAIISLLRDPVRRRAMATASRARHAALFTAGRMVEETASVYDRVLAGRR